MTYDATLLAKVFDRAIPEPNSGCWLWTQNVSKVGYGRTDLGSQRRQAHRVAWIAKNGPIPDGLHVCHKCDVRICVNPDHLWLGTQRDNMLDMRAKGRGYIPPKGPDAAMRKAGPKLTLEMAVAIRADGRRHRQIATDYGVDRSHVSAIKRGVTWPAALEAGRPPE